MAKARIFTTEEKEEMNSMAFDQCQDNTIAKVIGCDVKTLTKSFSKVLQQKRAEGKVALRRAQMKQALANPTMAIFLGKNYLEQTDSKELNLKGEVNIILKRKNG